MEEKKYVLVVDESEVIEELDFGSYKIIDTQVGFIFHVKGGYDILVRPRMRSLYQHLRWLVDTKKRYEELSETDKHVYDATFTATVANMEIPMFMASDDVALFSIAQTALECLNNATEKALSNALEPETPDENGEFEAQQDAVTVIEEAGKAIENQ